MTKPGIPAVKPIAPKGVVALFVSRVSPTDKFINDGTEIVQDYLKLKGDDCSTPIANRFISVGDKWDDIQAKLEAAFNDSSCGNLHLMLQVEIKVSSLFYKELMDRYTKLSIAHNRPSIDFEANSFV